MGCVMKATGVVVVLFGGDVNLVVVGTVVLLGGVCVGILISLVHFALAGQSQTLFA